MMRAFLVSLALLAAAGFTALGIWQIERRAWKLDLIARVESGIHAPPTALPPPGGWRAVDPHAHEYRRVRLSGAFLHDRETLVQAVTERGPGFWVMTPLRTAQGLLLVNRGFVSPEKAKQDMRWRGPDRSTATVTGLLRVTERGGGFLRANDPVANRWYSRDVAAIAHARGLPAVAPFFVDADATPNPGGYPVGGLTVIRFRNNHLVYALTWFALAGLCAAAAFVLVRRGTAN